MKNKTREIINYLEQKYKLEFETDWDQECYYKYVAINNLYIKDIMYELPEDLEDGFSEIGYYFNIFIETRYIDFYDDNGEHKLYFCYDDLEFDECINKIEDYLLKINYFKSINRDLKLEQLIG